MHPRECRASHILHDEDFENCNSMLCGVSHRTYIDIWLRKEKAQAYIIVYSGYFNLTSEIVKFSNKREDIKISAKNNHTNDICNYFTDIPHWG